MHQKAGCLLGWLLGRGAAGFGNQLPPVQVNTRFITPAERNFYRVLHGTIGDSAVILMQVSLIQLLYLPGSNRDNPLRASWLNRIRSRSLDFVLLDPVTLRPVVAIELDEPSHATPSRQTRDENVERLLDAAGLPLIRVLSSRTYSTNELAQALAPYLERSR